MQLAIYLRWAALLVAFVSLGFIAYELPLAPIIQALAKWLDQHGTLAPLVFSAIYTLATILLIPGPTLAIAAGAIFDFATAVAIVSLSNTLGAMSSFLIARYLARQQIASYALRHPKFQAIDQAIGHGSWKFVVLLRLAVGLPFNLENYLLGLTAIRFWPCLWASFFSMIPGTIVYVYIGHVAGLVANGEQVTSTLEWTLLGVGLLATVGLTTYLVRLANREVQLDEAVERMPVDQTVVESSYLQHGITAALWVLAASLAFSAIFLYLHRDDVTKWIEPIG